MDFCSNILADLVFMFDIAVNFRHAAKVPTPFYLAFTFFSSLLHSFCRMAYIDRTTGSTVRALPLIRKHYLQSWLALHLFSCIPLDWFRLGEIYRLNRLIRLVELQGLSDAQLRAYSLAMYF